MKEKKNPRNILWIVIGIGALLFILLMLISNVLDTGERLRNINVYLEYAFYVISALLFYLLIVNPIRIILLSPSFSLVTVLDEDNHKNLRVYKRISKNLKDNEYISEEECHRLESCETSGELKEELSKVFNTTIKKEINKIILKNAKTVLVSTAICQNGRLDTYSVLVINIKMIKEIVSKCGFRPTYPRLGKLAINVVSTALIAESLDGLDLGDILPQGANNFLAEMPFIKPVANSFLNGVSNALLTIRIGIITRKYLFLEGQLSKSQIRIAAIKESVLLIPIVVKDAILAFPSKVVNAIFKKKTPKDSSEGA